MVARSRFAVLLLTALLCLKSAAHLASKCQLPISSSTLLHWSVTEHLDDSTTVRVGTVEKTLNRLREIEGKIVIVSVAGPHSQRKSEILDDMIPHKVMANPISWELEQDELKIVIVPP